MPGTAECLTKSVSPPVVINAERAPLQFARHPSSSHRKLKNQPKITELSRSSPEFRRHGRRPAAAGAAVLVPVLDRAPAAAAVRARSSAGGPPAAVEAGHPPGAPGVVASCNAIPVAAAVAASPISDGDGAGIQRRWRCPFSAGSAAADAAVEQAVPVAGPRAAALAH